MTNEALELKNLILASIPKEAMGGSLWDAFRDALYAYTAKLRLELARGLDWDVEVIKGAMNHMAHGWELTGANKAKINVSIRMGDDFMVEVSAYHIGPPPERDIKVGVGFKKSYDSFSSGLGRDLVEDLKKHFAAELEAGKWKLEE